ncbi:lysylphosphatidylglycerol synthase transmembrane domain-containing protein [Neobacillus niacini]|uniref:lysylphosphatidylglycerol synthase transmembrane domain-containing protein n=1 Tax=Neobacillus niacini TaxID=86668 RepID=UPI002FFD9817
METKLDKKGLVIRIGGSTLLILWLVNKFEWNKILEIAKQGSLFYIIAAAIAIQLTVAPSILKWKMLVDSSFNQVDKKGASFNKLGRLYYIGLFFNNFLPGSVGGDVARVYFLGRITGIPIATASVGFERITSGAALIAIAIFASFSMESAREFLFPIFLGTGIILLVFLLAGRWIKQESRVKKEIPHTKDAIGLQKLKGALVKIGEAASDYRKEGIKWWLWIAILSILFQVGMALINHLLFLSFDISVPWVELLMIITLISVLTMLPISVNGIGVREGCYIFFFHELGVPDEISVTVSLMFFLLVSLSSLAGGFFWMVERGRKV